MTEYFDAHCHLNSGALGLEAKGICNAVQQKDWDNILLFAKNNLGGCIGIHPWYVNTAKKNWDTQMRQILYDNPNIMVGEVGLDKAHQDFDTQLQMFFVQEQIAVEFHRAIHIHCVRAWPELLAQIPHMQSLPAIILHAFSAPKEIAQQLKMFSNVYFSFGGAILNPQRQKRIAGAVQVIPNNKILIESDGEIGKGQNILNAVCSQIAGIKLLDKEILADILQTNTMQVIKNGQIV